MGSDDNVEYLPLIGESLSIKTRKQGRRGNISELKDIRDYSLSSPGKIKKRRGKLMGQKKMAQDCVIAIEGNKTYAWYYSIIRGIARNLMHKR